MDSDFTKYFVPLPANYPSFSLDASFFEIFSAGVKGSIRSIGSTGLLILGVIVSVVLIGFIFRDLFLEKLRFFKDVENREYRRKVKAADFHRNIESIVDDKVRDMEAGALAKARYRVMHPTAELEDAVHRREVSFQADLEFNYRNPLAYSIKRDSYRLMNDEYMAARKNNILFQ